jgi:hypothetical protein
VNIFLSYRRDDERHVAERVYEALVSEFGRESVFKDVDSVPMGADFRQVIMSAVEKCDVLLAFIGKQWLTISDDSGRRRIDNPDDFVRVEIETALDRDIPVIPVLVPEVRALNEESLPPSLSKICFRQSALIRPDPDFGRDMERLGNGITSAARAARVGLRQPGRKPAKLRYYCYVSRGKVDQLYAQVQPGDDTAMEEDVSSVGLLGEYMTTLPDQIASKAVSPYSGQTTIAKLRSVLNHIGRHEKVLDLSTLCREKAGVALDAFCYTYRGVFYVLGNYGRQENGGLHISGAAIARSPDDIIISKSLLLEPARQENSFREVGPNRGQLVSDMCIICSEVEEFTLRLACSYKYFSEMGGSWDERDQEWDVHPHSGNTHFFNGEVDTWLEALVFINGIRGKTILGTPLFVVHAPNPTLVL